MNRPADHSRLGTRECLNGIRAIAVISVIAFHLNYEWAAGGYFGVDIFFVLSGFLITSLLLREYTEAGYISIGKFWTRRARRLLPAMLVCLLGILLLARWIMRPDALGEVRTETLSALFYVSNWSRVVRGDSYFDLFSAKELTEHFWSLAIEEQFYLFWPFVAGAVFRWSRKSRGHLPAKERYGVPMIVVGVVGAVGSALVMAVSYEPSADNSALYFRTDTRLQAIFIGVTAAGLLVRIGRLDPGRQWLVPSAWAASLLLLMAMAFDIPETLLYRGGFFIVASLAGWIILVAMLSPRSSLDQVLKRSTLQTIGKLSYGLYLWHWPAILVADKLGWSRIPHDIAALTLTSVAAAVSYRLIERPIQMGRLGEAEGHTSSREVMVGFGMMAVVSVLSVGVTSGAEISMADRYERDQELAESAIYAKAPDRTEITVVGDSFGAQLGSDWSLVSDTVASISVTNLSDPTCSVPAGCVDVLDQWSTQVAAAPPDVLIVAVTDWRAFDAKRTFAVNDEFEYEEELSEEIALQMSALLDLQVPTIFITPSPALLQDGRHTRVLRRALVAFEAEDDIQSLSAEDLVCRPSVSCSAGTPDGVVAAGFANAVAEAARRAHVTDATGSDAAVDATRVLIVGDSIAWSIGSGWYDGVAAPPSDSAVLVLNRGRFFCQVDDRPSREFDGTVKEEPSACPDWRSIWTKVVTSFDPDVVVLPMSVWTIHDREIDGEWVTWTSPTYQADLKKKYTEAIEILGTSGAAVVLVSTAPQESTISFRAQMEEQNSRLRQQNSMARTIAVENPGSVSYLDLSDFVCPGDVCKSVQGLSLRPDGMHYSTTGSAVVADWLEPQLVSIARSRPAAVPTTSQVSAG